MRAGKLRHRILFQYSTKAADETGQLLLTWVDAATRWGSVEALNARELFNAQQVQSRSNHKIIIRNKLPAPAQPGAQFRAKFVKTGEADRIFNLTGSMNQDERSIYSVLLAEEAVGVTS